MGKKGGTKRPQVAPSLSHSSISLRQESTGKVQTKGASRNPKSFLKLEHLQNLAVWASGEASIPSLGAFFGRQFAATGEILAVQSEPSLIPCQRCETILQPGFNCTVRIEKTGTRARHRHKKPNSSMQNNVVYKCHFCSHWNLKRGTSIGHMKEICPSKAKPPKPSAKSEPSKSMPQKSASLEKVTRSKDEIIRIDKIALPPIPAYTSIASSPATPSARSGTTLLDAKRRKRKRNRSALKESEESESNNAAEDGETTVGVSSNRKRKSWTSLKEIAESNEHDSTRNVTNLTIPFSI